MNTQEAELLPAETALAVRDKETSFTERDAYPAPKTPQEMRVSEVSDALAPAYQQASKLDLTDQEIEALTAPFPDDAVEIRPHDGLIYIPHIQISDRLNKIFRPGKWALICRRHWIQDSVMYGEYVLLVRGCFVGESVGGHPYIANNPKTNYSDTLESTAAEALRRICGKRLSCGSQVWHPEYARQWVKKYGVQVRGKWERRMDEAPTTSKSPVPSAPPPKPTAPPAPANGNQGAPMGRLERAQALIKWLGDDAEWAHGYLCAFTPAGEEPTSPPLAPFDKLEDLAEKWLDAIKADSKGFLTRVREFRQRNEQNPTQAAQSTPTMPPTTTKTTGGTENKTPTTHSPQSPDPAELAKGICPNCQAGSLEKTGAHYRCSTQECGWNNIPETCPHCGAAEQLKRNLPGEDGSVYTRCGACGRAWYSGGDYPEPSEPEQQELPGDQGGEGVIEHISIQTGTKKNGQGWTRAGIKIDGEYYGTFDTKLIDVAKKLKGQKVQFSYEPTEKGKNLLGISL